MERSLGEEEEKGKGNVTEAQWRSRTVVPHMWVCLNTVNDHYHVIIMVHLNCL